MARYNVICSASFGIVLLKAFLVARVAIPPPMLGIMNSSRASSIRSILVYSASATESLYKIARELPIPIKFLPISLKSLTCEFNRYIAKRREECYGSQMLPEVHNQKILIFFVNSWHEQSSVVKKNMRAILFEQPTRLLILATDSHAKSLSEFAGRLCNVITVTSSDINYPEDYYRLCESRKRGSALLEEKGSATFPKGMRYRASMRQKGTNLELHSEALAILDSYKSLNNTVEEVGAILWVGVLEKIIDIALPPLPALILHDMHIFAGAHYAPCPMCFFTSKRKATVTTFVDSWRTFIWLAVIVPIEFAILVLYMNIRCRLFYSRQRRRHSSHILLFFISTLFGRPPTPAIVSSPTFRGLASASWTFGTLVLGFYIQSSITAIRLVPADVPVVGSFEEILTSAEAGALTPCYNDEWLGYLYSPSNDRDVNFRNGISRTGVDSAQLSYTGRGFSECYRRTQAGTHVALSVCTDEEVAATAKWNLIPGSHFFTTIRAPAIHIMNPDRGQHRRLLLAIWEHGLAMPHRRTSKLPESPMKEDSAEPFNLYFLPYITGCAISCLALCFETTMSSKFRIFWGQTSA